MLFDLRSRGRRRVIQVVYAFLAVLIGGGLVLFGVGGGAGSTGLLSQLAQQGNGSASGIKLYEKAMLKAQKQAQAQPNNLAAWDSYALAVFKLADTNYVTSSSGTAQGFTPAGAKELKVLESAWNHYLSLSPPIPDAALAADVSFAFGEYGVQEFKVAEGAAEIVATANPTSYSDYTTLALDAYLAKDKSAGQLAESRAIALAPKNERSQITSYLAQVGGPTGSSGTSGASSTTGSSAATGTSAATGSSGKHG